MSESKQYTVTNKEPGARGFYANGELVMVQPTMAGVEGTTIVALTEDEAKKAKRQGLTLKAVRGGNNIRATANLPAAGHVDVNAPDAADVLAGKSSSKGSKSEGGNDGDGEKPLSKMNRSELDGVVEAEKVDIGEAKTNAEVVAAIEAHRAKGSTGSGS